MALPAEFCYHTFGAYEEIAELIDSHRKADRLLQDKLQEKATKLLVPSLEKSGPIKYVDLVDDLAVQLGFSDCENIPIGIREAVMTAWHGGIFKLSADRTVTLNPKNLGPDSKNK